MKRSGRMIFALLIVVALIAMSRQVWASPRFAGSIPTNPPVGTYAPPTAVPTAATTGTPVPTAIPGVPVTGDKGQPVNMGTAVIAVSDPNTALIVTRMDPDIPFEIPLPEGIIQLADMFNIELDPPSDTVEVEVCFAIPPELKDKAASIFHLNKTVTPNVWEEIPLDTQYETEGKRCAKIAGGGYVNLAGKP